MYIHNIFPIGVGLATNLQLTSSGFFIDIPILKQVKIKRISFMVDLVTSGIGVVSFRKRPTIGSATGEIVLGILTIPATTVASKVLYKNITPTVLVPGNAIALYVTTSMASGSGFPDYEFDEDPETVANQTNMLASA